MKKVNKRPTKPKELIINGCVIAYCFIDKYRDITTDRRVRSICINNETMNLGRTISVSARKFADWFTKAAAWVEDGKR